MVPYLKDIPLKFPEKEVISDTNSGERQVIDPKVHMWLKGTMKALKKGNRREKKKIKVQMTWTLLGLDKIRWF